MILILLTFLLFIFIHFGVLVFIQIIILIIVFLSSNLLIGINPFSRELYIIRIMSICMIIIILYYNSITSSIGIATVLPLSIKQISYYEEFRISKIIDSNSMKYKLLNLKDTENEITDFLYKLDFNDNFIVIMEFIQEKRYFEIDEPLILLSKPFMINRFSCQKTISNFIYERLGHMMDFYYFDDSVRLECKYREGPIIQLKYAKFYFE
jgi:hypothetical protein